MIHSKLRDTESQVQLEIAHKKQLQHERDEMETKYELAYDSDSLGSRNSALRAENERLNRHALEAADAAKEEMVVAQKKTAEANARSASVGHAILNAA